MVGLSCGSLEAVSLMCPLISTLTHGVLVTNMLGMPWIRAQGQVCVAAGQPGRAAWSPDSAPIACQLIVAARRRSGQGLEETSGSRRPAAGRLDRKQWRSIAVPFLSPSQPSGVIFANFVCRLVTALVTVYVMFHRCRFTSSREMCVYMWPDLASSTGCG